MDLFNIPASLKRKNISLGLGAGFWERNDLLLLYFQIDVNGKVICEEQVITFR